MSVDAQIAEEVRALARLDLEALRTEWRRRFGAPTRLRSVELLRYMMAWRIQTAAFGDHDPDMKRALRRPAPSGPLSASLSSGTQLSREWRGQVHVVHVLERGFAHQGRVFTSLSAVASEIAGVKWNGRRFFGLDRQ